MTSTPLSFPTGKAEFSLEEAATLLGITATELASLVDDSLNAKGSEHNLARMRFRPMLSFSKMQARPRSNDSLD